MDCTPSSPSSLLTTICVLPVLLNPELLCFNFLRERKLHSCARMGKDTGGLITPQNAFSQTSYFQPHLHLSFQGCLVLRIVGGTEALLTYFSWSPTISLGFSFPQCMVSYHFVTHFPSSNIWWLFIPLLSVAVGWYINNLLYFSSVGLLREWFSLPCLVGSPRGII